MKVQSGVTVKVGSWSKRVQVKLGPKSNLVERVKVESRSRWSQGQNRIKVQSGGWVKLGGEDQSGVKMKVESRSNWGQVQTGLKGSKWGQGQTGSRSNWVERV